MNVEQLSIGCRGRNSLSGIAVLVIKESLAFECGRTWTISSIAGLYCLFHAQDDLLHLVLLISRSMTLGIPGSTAIISVPQEGTWDPDRVVLAGWEFIGWKCRPVWDARFQDQHDKVRRCSRPLGD
jgi:hypothetical protein